MTPEQLDEHIRQMVADWPPFTPEQKARLHALFRTAPQTPAVPARRKAAA